MDVMPGSAPGMERGRILEGFDIVCLGTVEWLVVHSVAEYTMSLLADRNRVLFVEPLGSPLTLVRDRRRRKRRSGLRRLAKGLWTYTPPPVGLPGAARRRWVAEVNGRILARLLSPVMRALGLDRPVVWTFQYNSASTVRRLPRCLSIYDCIDEDAALATSDDRRRLVGELDAGLCREADIVFGVTEGLAGPRRRLNPATFEVNCAAAADFFGQALLEGTAVPPDIAGLRRPVLGYLGGIDPWRLDVELVRHLARARPDWSIALVGYMWFGFDSQTWRDCPNVHYLGAKPYEEFPAYLKGMDVCLMPFRLNDITLRGDALKCYEYLAAGKPVVSTPVAVARRFPEVVRMAGTPDEFLQAVEDALARPLGAERYRDAITGHTWADRVAQKSSIILDFLARRCAAAGAGG